MVTADQLRFADAPKARVRFTGGPGRESVSQSERTNLPYQVEGKVDYRDVRVDYILATRLTDASAAPPPSPRPD